MCSSIKIETMQLYSAGFVVTSYLCGQQNFQQITFAAAALII